MVGALGGDAGSSMPSLKRWVFCATSRRTFVCGVFFSSFFSLSLYSVKVSQQTDYTSAYFMAGESRRPWQISIRIKRALLHHAEVPTAVDFLMRGRGGAWSFATRGAAWPWVLREAGREELPGMLQLRWKFSSPRAGFQYPLMVVLSSGRLENMSEFVKVPRF